MRFILYQDAAKEWRWRLLAANGRRVADSGEGYTTRAGATHGIDLVKSVTDGTPVKEVTEAQANATRE